MLVSVFKMSGLQLVIVIQVEINCVCQNKILW